MVNRLAGQVWMQGEDLEVMEIQVVFGDGENGQIITNIELIYWTWYIRKKINTDAKDFDLSKWKNEVAFYWDVLYL